ncbi:phage tail tape measure protein [Verrucosispora sp. SN26_14.1]|uniref:phage tail tape measure protein n=1 Tax=Verrucosispora sp. SN26_14.1 TaxID=2527879 RepID=UPI001034D2A4|nr:phage tail tape measure protein [Verrucosispora sp. SN26_14.1]TBL44236.1 phage tail tape measure protein [Verrucosispora sp. SN26_14.1]
MAALRTIGVRIQADVAGYKARLNEASKSTKDFAAEMNKAATGGQLDQVADSAALMGAGLVAAYGFAINEFAKFEKQMSSVQAATQASAQEMELLREASMQAGKDTAYSATEAGQAVEELAKAGVATADILRGGLAGALDLAAAGQLDVAEAAETAASAMVQFKLDGSKVPHIADLLAAAAGKAQGSVHDMGYALSQAGLVSAQMGLSIEDTVGTLASFASAGLLGSDAGTSLKTAMLMLANPTEKAADLMEELGLVTYDANGNFVGIVNLAGQLKTQLGQLTQEQRNAALAQIFGSDAIRAASILYEQGAHGIQGWIDKVDDQGYAAETARLKTDNLIGDLERLRGELDNLAIQAGEGSAGGLRWLAQAAEGVVAQFGSLPPAVSGTALAVTGLTGGLLLLGAGWVKARRSNQEMLSELRATGPAGRQAARGLETAQRGATRAAGAFVALQLAGAALSSLQTDLKPQVEALGKGLATWGQSGHLAGEAARVLGKDMEDLSTGMKYLADTDNSRRQWTRRLQDGLESLIPGLDGTNRSLTKTRERVEAMDQALAGMVQQGQADQAAAVFAKLSEEAAKQGVTVDELRKIFPGYVAALETAGPASDKAAGAVGSVGKAAEEAAKRTQELKDAFDSLFESQMTADRAALKSADAIEALDETFRKHKSTIDITTESGKANRKAILDRIDTIKEERDARLAQGESLDKVNRRYVKDIDGLRKSMRQAGFTKEAVEELTGAYRDIPRTARTTVEVVGDKKARDKLGEMYVRQRALAKGTTIAEEQRRYDKLNAFADGGWTGPGGKYTPAGVVHADEFVIRKESRQRIEQRHPGLLEEMNATGQVHGYYNGGRVVRWPFPVTAEYTKVPSWREVAAQVTPNFGPWPPSPSAQRGDSDVWRGIVARIRATGPLSGSFGNGYRPGDPLWHGSGRAVDWMGYNQDALSTLMTGWRPLELIHRTNRRDYAYTRGVNKGSFSNALMEAHRNHIHIAMADGGVIREPVYGIGVDTGRSYSFAERGPETVVPGVGAMAGGGRTVVEHIHRHVVVLEGNGVLREFRREVELNGGDVQNTFGRKKR